MKSGEKAERKIIIPALNSLWKLEACPTVSSKKNCECLVSVGFWTSKRAGVRPASKHCGLHDSVSTASPSWWRCWATALGLQGHYRNSVAHLHLKSKSSKPNTSHNPYSVHPINRNRFLINHSSPRASSGFPTTRLHKPVTCWVPYIRLLQPLFHLPLLFFFR